MSVLKLVFNFTGLDAGSDWIIVDYRLYGASHSVGLYEHNIVTVDF